MPQAIAAAAQRGKIHVLVNYETTWYRSHRAVWRLMHEQKTGGRIRKIVAMDGHFGPKEIGTQPEFFEWLSDPVRNGGGALYDFGCYGANIATWLLDNARPLRVTAVTQRNKPAIYPKVDDEATIVIEYEGAQAIVQASWNWPDHRKDLEVYTESGAAWATGGGALRTKLRGQPIVDVPVEDWPEDEQNALELPHRRRAWPPGAVGADLAREQPHRLGDPRRGAREREDGEDGRAVGALTGTRPGYPGQVATMVVWPPPVASLFLDVVRKRALWPRCGGIGGVSGVGSARVARGRRRARGPLVVLAAAVAWLVFALAIAHERLASQAAANAASHEALQRREPQYRRVVEHVDQVIFQLDRRGPVDVPQRAWQGLSGHEVQRLARPAVRRLPASRRPAGRRGAVWPAARRAARRSVEQDLRFLTRDGPARWTPSRRAPLMEDGSAVGVAGTISDITARRQAQQDLERARVDGRTGQCRQERVPQVDEPRDAHAAQRRARRLMELLAATPLDAQQSRYVAAARASATHLATLITRHPRPLPARGRCPGPRAHPVRPARSDREQPRRRGRPRPRTSSCGCRARSRQDVPTWVVGDAGRLRQVLVNLLANAVKFTERGEVHVQADAQVDLYSRQAMLRLEVHDTGIGMTPELVDRLFLPFTPGDVSSARRHSGTGLGLTICKRLVEAMQGTIAARSVERAGATFTVTMPIEVADAAMVESQRQGDAPLRVLAVLQDETERADIGEPPRRLAARCRGRRRLRRRARARGGRRRSRGGGSASCCSTA